MAREIPVTQARADFAELVNRVVYGDERIVVTRHGRPLVALVSAADLDRLNALDAVESLEASRALDAAETPDAVPALDAVADLAAVEPLRAADTLDPATGRGRGEPGRLVRLTAPQPDTDPGGRYGIAARHQPPGRSTRHDHR